MLPNQSKLGMLQKFLLLASMLLALLSQPISARKVLLINDIHLDLDSELYYSKPGTETNLRTLNKVLESAS